MARFCVVTETYHVSPACNPSFVQQRLLNLLLDEAIAQAEADIRNSPINVYRLGKAKRAAVEKAKKSVYISFLHKSPFQQLNWRILQCFCKFCIISKFHLI